MAMSKVVKSIKPISKLKDYYYKGWHDIFIEKENVNVHFGNGEVEIIDLANAMRPDYECCTFTFSEIEFDSFGDMPFSKVAASFAKLVFKSLIFKQYFFIFFIISKSFFAVIN